MNLQILQTIIRKQKHDNMMKLNNDQLLESVFVKIFMDIVQIFKTKTFNCLDMRHYNPAERTGL